MVTEEFPWAAADEANPPEDADLEVRNAVVDDEPEYPTSAAGAADTGNLDRSAPEPTKEA